MILIFLILGAFFNRIRGGWLFTSNGGAVNVLAFGLTVGIILQSVMAGVAAAAGMWIGQAPGWGRYIGALGGWEDKELTEFLPVDAMIEWAKYSKRLWGYLGLSLRGAVWGIAVGVAVAFWIPSAGILAPFVGLLMAPCYLATIEAARWLKVKNPAGTGWEWGEYLFGAVFWAFILAQVLKGSGQW